MFNIIYMLCTIIYWIYIATEKSTKNFRLQKKGGLFCPKIFHIRFSQLTHKMPIDISQHQQKELLIFSFLFGINFIVIKNIKSFRSFDVFGIERKECGAIYWWEMREGHRINMHINRILSRIDNSDGFVNGGSEKTCAFSFV